MKIVTKKCKEDNIRIHPHCNSPACSQKILELNPAIGCQFQCQYCCLYTQENENKFSYVTIYEDYPELLENYILKNINRLSGSTFFFSFESDCFQNALVSTGITQEILTILHKYNLPYFILTKGGLPNKDIANLLIATKTIAQVVVNDTMPNEEYRSVLEPYAASIEDRYNLVKFCIENKIFTTISFSPIFPFGNLDYIKEKIQKYVSIGINHFRFDMLELSIDSYHKLIELLPSHESEFESLYMDSNAIENNWKVPNTATTLKRYKPSKKFMANTYDELKKFVKSIDKNATVSICDGAIINNELLAEFNKNSYAKGMNCMGVKIV